MMRERMYRGGCVVVGCLGLGVRKCVCEVERVNPIVWAFVRAGRGDDGLCSCARLWGGGDGRVRPRKETVVRDSFVSYGLSNVCVSSVCLHVVRGSGRMGPNRAAASSLSEEKEGERRGSFSDDIFYFK